MINLGGYDFELGTLASNPKFGYITEYREYKTISGKIRRDVKGKRFQGTFSYGYLTATEISNINSLLDTQKTAGYISAEIETSDGTFTGNVFLTIDDTQVRFSAGKWVDWKIIVTGVDLV